MKNIKDIIKTLQDKGIPVIMLQDPLTKLPSLTFTLAVLSAAMVIFGVVGKFAKLAGGYDVENSLSFFGMCAGLYLGRKLTAGKTTVEKDKE